MDPITIITLALAAGAAAGLKSTAEQAVKDAYFGLKKLIETKFASVSGSLGQLEQKPESKARRDAVKEDLESAKADTDEQVLSQAQAVLKAVQEKAPEVAQIIGVDLEDIKAGALRLKDIIASGTGVRVKKGEFSGDIEIESVRAGQSSSKN